MLQDISNTVEGNMTKSTDKGKAHDILWTQITIQPSLSKSSLDPLFVKSFKEAFGNVAPISGSPQIGMNSKKTIM